MQDILAREEKVFLGTYRHQLDAKGRFRLPAKFKAELGERPVFAKGANGALYVLSQKELTENIAPKIANISLFDESVQKPLRLLFASAFESEEDAQGRILLPKELRSYANLTKDIVSIGAFNRVEIWSAEAWDKYSSGADFDALSTELASKGV